MCEQHLLTFHVCFPRVIGFYFGLIFVGSFLRENGLCVSVKPLISARDHKAQFVPLELVPEDRGETLRARLQEEEA